MVEEKAISEIYILFTLQTENLLQIELVAKRLKIAAVRCNRRNYKKRNVKSYSRPFPNTRIVIPRMKYPRESKLGDKLKNIETILTEGK